MYLWQNLESRTVEEQLTDTPPEVFTCSTETPIELQVKGGLFADYASYKTSHLFDYHESLDRHDSIEDAIADIWCEHQPIWKGTNQQTPTPEWHGTATDVRVLVRTHTLRLVKGWKNESAVVTYLENNPSLARAYGYDRIDEVSQSKLWRAWNKRYSETLKQAIEQTAEMLVEHARDAGVPAPDAIFRPSEQTQPDASERTERELISKNTKEVWQQAKPFIEDSFHLNRGDNAQIPESAWWEQHTYLGTRSDMFAESGADSFHDDTTRDRAPRGRHHRDKLRVLDVDAVRQMMQSTTKALVARARHNSELVGKLEVAIDITKGHPWTGHVERNDRGHNQEPYILGYKDGELHYQWASIQVVGHDIPLVLDVMPVKRGDARADIVDELLGNAKEIVGGIELVMMDREFDGEGVKRACEDHGVYYLNPARKRQSERAKCTRLRRAGRAVHIEEQGSLAGTTRNRIYLPSTATDHDRVVDPDPLADAGLRQEMLGDLQDKVGVEMDDDREDDGGGFADVIGDLAEEEAEQETVGNDEDKEEYVLFETNHPLVELDGDQSEAERAHMAERMVRRYRHRWGIENGFKKIKTFMVRSASKDHRYRFFNFAFACVLYNVWRLVDLLVKLAIDGENASYSPKVDANRFLTFAKKYYGLDPPD